MLSPRERTVIGEEILRDDAEAIRARLENGLDPDELLEEGPGAYSMLQAAASEGAVQVLRCLVEAGVDVNKRTSGFTALMMACASDKTEIVRILLDAGADPNIQSGPDDDGDSKLTALMEAAGSRSLDSVKLLLTAGADPTMLTRKGRSSVNFVPGGEPETRREIITTLVEAGCPVVGPCLIWPAEMGDVELVLYLLEHGADPNMPSDKYEQTPGGPGHLPIHVAMMARWTGEDFREMAVALGTYDPEQKNRYLQVLQELIKAGADVNLESKGLWMIYKSRIADDPQVTEILRRAGWHEPAEREKPCADIAKPAANEKPARAEPAAMGPLGAKDFIKFHYASQPDWSVLAVLAPIEAVTDAFARYRDARGRVKDVAVHPMKEHRGIPVDEIPAVQMRGNPWTVLIRSFQMLSAVELADVPDEARALSEELSTRAVTFMGEDTSGALGYELFENGTCIEKAIWDSGGDIMSWESQLRNQPKWPHDEIKSVDSAFSELGIYVPVCYAEGSDSGEVWLAAEKKIIAHIECADLIDL